MRWESAIEHYLNTDTPEAKTRISSCYLQMGASEFKRGNWEQAILHYRNTIETDEMIINIANSYYQMAEVELEKNNWYHRILPNVELQGLCKENVLV